MDLTVNQRLDWFDSSVRSKEVYWGVGVIGNAMALQVIVRGSIPLPSTKYNATLADVVIASG